MSSSSSSTTTENTQIFPSPTNNSTAPNNQAPPQSSSLYLFTFLATLLLLLAVSCAIVIRSFILRRRFRRRIEEAIAAGVLVPGALDDPSVGGIGRGRRRDFGEKPKLWEVWVDEKGYGHDGAQQSSSKRDSLGKDEGKWEGILPVSARLLSLNTPKPIPLPGNTSSPSLSPPEEHESHRLLISRLLGRRPYPTTPSPAPASSPQNESQPQLDTTYTPSMLSKDREKEDERLQVSVLISMPNPNMRRLHESDGAPGSLKGKEKGPGIDDGEAEIPDVVFGVAEVDLRA